MSAPDPLAADRGEIARLVAALFRHASPGGLVSLRAFPDDDNSDEPWRPDLWRWLRPAGDIVGAAVTLATGCANAAEAVVFCPPIATFRDRSSAAAENVAEGLVLSVEVDDRPHEAQQALEALLGPATVIVASGGEWLDPDTGEVQDKLHLHWRLATPTRSPAGHAALRVARKAAQHLVAADPTAIAVVHPLRWPGSWHRKGAPRLARIVGGDPEREINLADALAALPPVPEEDHVPGEPQADITDVETWLTVIPNDARLMEDFGLKASANGSTWEAWNRIGMATWRATGGSDAGKAAFKAWSAKSPIHIEATTEKRWKHYFGSPPTRIGAGTLWHLFSKYWVDAMDDQAACDDVGFESDDVDLLGGDDDVDADRGLDPDREPASSAEPVSASDAGGKERPNGHDVEPPARSTPRPNGHDGKATAAATAAWPELIDIVADADLTPPFPTHLLPRPWSIFVADVADRMQVPADFVAIPLLVAAATMLGKEFRIAPKLHDDWTERPCLWGVVIAPPGAKKTPPMEAAMRPVSAMQREMWDRYRAELTAWKIAKEQGDAGPEPLLETITTSEATVEALVGLLGEHNANPRGVVLYRDELSGFHEAMNKYRSRGGDDRQFFLQCWSGGSFRVDRAGKGPTFLPDLYLSIIGTIQPDVIQRVLRGGDADGLTARYQLMVWPAALEKIDVVDRRPDYEAINAVARRLRDIRDRVALDNDTFRFSGRAYAVFNRWLLNNENRPERRESNAFGAHLAKYPGLFARLSLVLHHMRHDQMPPMEVSGETAEAVQAMIDGYFEPHARRVYGHLGAHPARAGAARIARWVREKRVDKFTVRDVRRNDWAEFAKAKDGDAIVAALEYLEGHGWVRLDERGAGPRGGRPTVVAAVNPAAIVD